MSDQVRRMAVAAARSTPFTHFPGDPRFEAFVEGWERGYRGQEPRKVFPDPRHKAAHMAGHDAGRARREGTAPPPKKKIYRRRFRARRAGAKPNEPKTPGLFGPVNERGKS